jgi:2-amino-4-hydroxy-6-hydroxymethyldihydropteridine diphosphokinase
MDIDIIFFDKMVYSKNSLTIPHLKWQERNSVIIPMIFLKD